MYAPAPNHHRPRRRPQRYWLRRLGVLLILLLPVFAWQAWALYTEIPIKAEGHAAAVPPNEPVYLLVMGVDRREHDIGRSDTMILMRLARDGKQVDLINIPRDTRVPFSDGASGKINAAYSTGGPEGVVEVVSRLMQVPKPYYLTIDFAGFEEIIDALGGIEIEVDQDYHYEDPFQDLYIDISAGRQTMYGQTALHFVRLRYDGKTGSDIGRIERQQQFITALQAKLLSSPFELPNLLAIARSSVRTNIPERDQLGLAKALYEARNSLHMHTLPGLPDDETGDWVFDPTAYKGVTNQWPIR